MCQSFYMTPNFDFECFLVLFILNFINVSTTWFYGCLLCWLWNKKMNRCPACRKMKGARNLEIKAEFSRFRAPLVLTWYILKYIQKCKHNLNTMISYDFYTFEVNFPMETTSLRRTPQPWKAYHTTSTATTSPAASAFSNCFSLGGWAQGDCEKNMRMCMFHYQ